MLLLAVLDLVPPIAVVLLLALWNAPHRSSARSEALAWLVAAAVALPSIVLAVRAAGADPHGFTALILTAVAGPLAWFGAGLHLLWAELLGAVGIGVSKDLDGAWLVAAVLWALALPLLIRRIRQRARTPHRSQEPVGLE